MSDAQVFRGTRYPSPQAAARAREEYEEMVRRQEAAEAARATRFEGELRGRFLSSGGSIADWEKEKAGLIKRAREEATIHGSDEARARNAARYRAGLQ